MTAAQVPLISPGSTSPVLPSASNYFFRTVPSDRYQGRFAAEQVGGAAWRGPDKILGRC